MTHLLSRQAVPDHFATSSWQRIVFSEFESTVSSKTRPFPCIFGVTGLQKDQLRFTFPDPLTPETVAPLLEDYVANARSFGRMTSLVVFGRPGPVQPLEDYRNRFWSLLDGLEKVDAAPRPASVPRAIDTDLWEFCFAGEPIFVACNTPAHVLRQSRRSTSFTVIFQPRWIFDGIMNTDAPAATRAVSQIHERLEAFDAVAPNPNLGHYETPGTREYQQYFIGDTNETPRCPFHQLSRREDTDDTKQAGKVA
jgi:FPC/CPF motif-containing protein YcgG